MKKVSMRLLICAGGTGGGVYPALSVLKQMMSTIPDLTSGKPTQAGESPAEELQVLWVGGIGGMEEDLVKREGLRFEAIPAAGVHGVGIPALPGNLLSLGRGYLSSRRILRKFRPDVLFFTGGYVAVPMAMAARSMRRLKSLLYVPDIEPGLALKVIARFSDCITLTVVESKQFFPRSPTRVVTGYPLRPELNSWTPAEARALFALTEQLPVLLVLGGSRGARSINQAIVAALPELLKDMQIIHITGNLDWPVIDQARKNLSTIELNRYRPYPYLYDEIGAALSVSDLAVSRAGASTLGELPAFGLPAILVPYPYAWRYQRVNARYLVQHGAAVLLDDSQLADQLIPVARGLLADKEQLNRMSQAMQALANPAAASSIADLLKELAFSSTRTGSRHVPNLID